MELNKRLIGTRIMLRRKSLGLTQEALSEIIGISKNHLSSIERGIYVPTVDLLFKVCNTLGSTPDYYLIGKIDEDADEMIETVGQLPDNAQRMLIKLIKTFLDNYEYLT